MNNTKEKIEYLAKLKRVLAHLEKQNKPFLEDSKTQLRKSIATWEGENKQIELLELSDRQLLIKVGRWLVKNSSAFSKSKEKLDVLYKGKLIYKIEGFRIIQEIYKSIPESILELEPIAFKLFVRNLLKVLIKREIIFLLNLKKILFLI